MAEPLEVMGHPARTHEFINHSYTCIEDNYVIAGIYRYRPSGNSGMA